MFQKPLREYEVVSLASGIDVRRFSWIRPLAGDYANNFANVAALYAGDPTSPEAWRAAIARAQQHVRRRDDVAALIAAQQQRRAARRGRVRRPGRARRGRPRTSDTGGGQKPRQLLAIGTG